MRLRRSTASRAGATVFALGASCFSSEARAFCREVTVQSPKGYDPAVSGCFPPLNARNGILEVYWKNHCVGYSLQRNASKQVTFQQATRVAADAFAAWGLATCSGGGIPSVMAVDEGPVDCDRVQYNNYQGNQHVIVFRDNGWPNDDSSNTLAYTTLQVDLTTGEIVDADMEINSSDYTLVVDGPAPPGGYDLLSIMTHEAGHFLGLAHSADRNAVMYAHYHPGSTALTPDDVAGICLIYPSDGMRTTSNGPIGADACDPTPHHGFSSQCAPDGGGPVDSGVTVALCPPASGGCAVGTTACLDHGVSGAADVLSPPQGLGFAGLGLLGGALACRRSRRMRTVVTALGVSLAAAGASVVGMRDAQASVSIAVLFDELVRGASGAALVTPTEQHALREGGRIVTYTRVRVDALIAGQLAGDVWVRTLGGAVGNIGEIVEGEAAFALGQASLVFLRLHLDPVTKAAAGAFVVVERAQGQFPVVAGGDRKLRLARARDAGALVAPPSERVARFAQLHPGGDIPRLASDVLHGRFVEDASRDIAAAWAQLRGR